MKNQFTPEQIEIAEKISSFYLRKNNFDYKKTNEEIEKVRIQNVEKTEKGITIFTERPGLLIGWRGENINQLQEFLNCEIRIEEVDSLSGYMYCYDPADFFDSGY